MPDAMTKAAADVLAERRRQVEAEGWTLRHDDDRNVGGELASAAACYALIRSHTEPTGIMGDNMIAIMWPWLSQWWKPTSRRRDLVKAAALLLAEIERLDRAEEREASNG